MRAFGTEISGNRVRNGELSENQRTYLIAKAQAGVRTKEIADDLGCSQSCVQKTIQRYNNTGSPASRPRMGRPRKITRRLHRWLLIMAKKFPDMEYRTLLSEAGLWPTNQPSPTISTRTIQRSFTSVGYRKFRAKRRPKINRSTALLRLKLCRGLRNFNWRTTTLKFSDECSVVRGSGHNKRWVFRQPKDKWHRKMVEEFGTGKQPGRMVWGAIWMTPEGEAGRSPLVIMTRDSSAKRNGYTAWSYQQALEEGLLPDYRPGELFMQDNACVHTARTSKDFLEIHGVHTIEWPPYSPDLNPIEHMWWALKKKLHQLHPEFDCMGTSQEEWDHFEMGLKEAWAAIPNSLICKLIMSMPKRLRACTKNRGYHTKY